MMLHRVAAIGIPVLFTTFLGFSTIRTSVRVLDEDNWHEMLSGEWMVEFFAPWCPACQQLEPIWQEFSSWSEDLGIKIGTVDVTANPGLTGRFAITALPTIFHVKDGVFRHYRGSKLKENLISFVEDKKWVDIEPIPSWKAPQAVIMSGLSWFFKMSMLLRKVHNYMLDMGFPTWGSYAVFGIATILFGTILGLIIVCIIDLFSSKRPVPQQKSRLEPDEKKNDEREREDADFGGEDVIRDITEPEEVAGERQVQSSEDNPEEIAENVEEQAEAVAEDETGHVSGGEAEEQAAGDSGETLRRRIVTKSNEEDVERVETEQGEK